MALSDKAKRVNFIVSCEGANSTELAQLGVEIGVCLQNMEAVLYAYILHERDTKPDGTMKTPHFHVVAEFPCAKRLATWLNALAGSLNLNPLAVSVEKCRSFEGSFQYLVHKNDPDKHQYDPSTIKSNLSEDNFNLYMSAEPDALTMDRLISLCETYKFPIDVAKVIGLGRYQIYRPVIQDIYTYLKRKKFEERFGRGSY